jgi:hypothetical protein
MKRGVDFIGEEGVRGDARYVVNGRCKFPRRSATGKRRGGLARTRA